MFLPVRYDIGPQLYANAYKAVNALLIGLDRLRNRPNVLIICTSNLMEAMVQR